MRISSILRVKGDRVSTIGPGATAQDAAAQMARDRIGALVVVEGTDMVGIISERDMVRVVGENGADALSQRVADVMSSPVQTCRPEDSVDEVMALMTERRFRHLPVVVEGQMVGIVSIGDVVKNRVDHLESERQALTEYISTGR